MKKTDLTYRQGITAFLLTLFIMLSLLRTEKHYIQFIIVAVCILPAVCLFVLRTVTGKGTDDLIISAAVLVILFIAGGPVFDFTITIIGTPDIERENRYAKLLSDSVFTYLYMFPAVIVWGVVIKGMLWIKHRFPTVFNMKNTYIFFLLWAVVLIIISHNLISWMSGMGWLGIKISHVYTTSALMIVSSVCFGLYAALTWKSYKKLYQPEITVKLGLHIISLVCAFIIVFTVCFLSVVRYSLNKAVFRYLDYNINYIAGNNMMNKYAEIDDIIQMITSNPHIGGKQTNGADALWEYCSYNIEERREEFVSRIKKTSGILKFSERRLKPDDGLAATVDTFSTEIADKAWMYNVLFFTEKYFLHDDRSGTVLLAEHRLPSLRTFIYYSEIMAVRISRLHRQGKTDTAKELYMKTLHLSWMLFNGDSVLSQVAGLGVMKKICRDEIISSEIFSEYERKHLNRLKENILFILKKVGIGIKYNCFRPITLTNPVVFYYPDSYNKVTTLLEPHRGRKFIIPFYYEMLYAEEVVSVIDGGSGILFPLPDDSSLKKMIKIYNTEKQHILKKASRQTENNIESCKSGNCDPAIYIEDSKLRFILKFAYERHCKVLLWYLRPFVWYELMVTASQP